MGSRVSPLRPRDLLPEVGAQQSPLVDCLGDTHIRLDSEHLVCMSATFDAAATENEPGARWRMPTRKKPNCTACLQVVTVCTPWVPRS